MGTNGISVYAHGANYMPALLVYSASITTWTFVTVVVANDTPALYLNGQLVATGLQCKNPMRLKLENVGGSYGTFKGLVDEISVLNRSLNSSEIGRGFSFSCDMLVRAPWPWWMGQLSAAAVVER